MRQEAINEILDQSTDLIVQKAVGIITQRFPQQKVEEQAIAAIDMCLVAAVRIADVYSLYTTCARDMESLLEAIYVRIDRDARR